MLFVVFEVSGWIDALTTQRLIEATSSWQPQSTAGVVGRSVVLALLSHVGADGVINTLLTPLTVWWLGPVQITTLLVFLTFYVPCISTFAVMHRTLGRQQAVFSVLLSVAVALLLSGVVRLLLLVVQALLA